MGETRQIKPVRINEDFKPLYTSKKRYFILTGGRGSLKTSTVMDFVARLTYQKNQVILYTRYTMSSARSTIVPLFKKVLERMNIENDFNILADKVVNKKNGSYIYFSGIKTSSGDQTGKLKSLPDVTTWVIEEGEDFNSEAAFESIDDSIRVADIQNRIIWIQNPTTKEHFIYKKFIENNSKQIGFYGYNVTVSNHSQVEHIHTTYHLAAQLGYLSPSWIFKINEAKKRAEIEIEKGTDRHETKYYYKYIGGWLERAEGCIYTNWSEGSFERTLYHGHGLDYGYNPDPLAMIEIAIDEKRKLIFMRENIYATELTDEQVVEAVANSVESKRDLIVSDTNEPRTSRKLRNSGFNVIPAQKEKGSISEGIRELQSYQFVVDPGSHKLKTELNNYVWNDKKASIPIDDFNHLLDALRYIFRKLKRPKKKGVRRAN